MLAPQPPPRVRAGAPDVAGHRSAKQSLFTSIARLAAATVVVLSPGSLDLLPPPAYAGGSVGQPFGGSNLGGPPIVAVSAVAAPDETATTAPDVAPSAVPSAGGFKIGESERELLKSAFAALDDGDLKEGTATAMRCDHRELELASADITPPHPNPIRPHHILPHSTPPHPIPPHPTVRSRWLLHKMHRRVDQSQAATRRARRGR